MTGNAVAVGAGTTPLTRELVLALLCCRCQQPAGELRLPEPPALKLPALLESSAGVIADHFERKTALPLRAILDDAQAGDYATAIARLFAGSDATGENGAPTIPVICEGCRT